MFANTMKALAVFAVATSAFKRDLLMDGEGMVPMIQQVQTELMMCLMSHGKPVTPGLERVLPAPIMYGKSPYQARAQQYQDAQSQLAACKSGGVNPALGF